MSLYRFPISEIWNCGNYREFISGSPQQALKYYQDEYPLGSTSVTIHDLQVKIGDFWQQAVKPIPKITPLPSRKFFRR